ncbi:MAG: hypothetical protein MUC95_08930 [Spirochaetes bacterium]|nr:hypothetical protein [Spirochaetota bacterium]
MFSNYFQKIEKGILKKAKPAQKGGAKSGKGAAGKSAKKAVAPKHEDLKTVLNNIIPSNLKLDSAKLIDPSGYTPDGVDFIVYRELCRDMINIMGGYVPCDLVHGTYHIAEKLNKDSLNNALTRVLQTKKINRYSETESQTPPIPAFLIAYDTDLEFSEIKNFIIDHYMAKGIDPLSEVDIIAIFGKGVIIKNWREKRSYIAIETGKDTLMWFFILMNEYLDITRGENFDLRSYVKQAENYKEY